MAVRDGQDGGRSSQTNEVLRASSQYLGYGMTFALSTLLFLLAGHWVDERLGTSPLLAIVGMLVGAGAGFYYLYMHVTRSDGGAGEREEGEKQ